MCSTLENKTTMKSKGGAGRGAGGVELGGGAGGVTGGRIRTHCVKVSKNSKHILETKRVQ